MKAKLISLSASILSLIFLLTIFSCNSYATETRVASMGGVGYFMRDNSNVFYFPGSVAVYGNQVIAELRTKNYPYNYTIGAHLPLGSFIFGAYLNNLLDIPTDIINDVTPDLALERSSALFLGGKFGSMNVGLMLSLALDSRTDQHPTISGTEDETQSARYIGLAAGISSKQLDLGVRIELPGASYEYEQDKDSWDGLGLGMSGRLFMRQSEKLEIVPVGTFFFGSSAKEEKSPFGKDETDYTDLNIGLGLGVNYHLTEQNLFVFGLEAFGYSKSSYEIKQGSEHSESEITLPGLYLGLESQIKPWLIGRIGASQVYVSESESSKPYRGKETTDSQRSSAFDLSLGLAVKLGSFLLDVSFNEGLLFDGPNVISGQDNRLAHRISITYQF